VKCKYAYKPKECPECTSNKIAKILYGMPDYEIIKDKLKSGKIVLGGCVMEVGAPVWQCTNCNKKIYKEYTK
jgi:ribosomal protein L37AE/L43A